MNKTKLMKVTQLSFKEVPNIKNGTSKLVLAAEYPFHIEGWRVFIISETENGTFIGHQFNKDGRPIGEFVKESVEEVIKLREECIHG